MTFFLVSCGKDENTESEGDIIFHDQAASQSMQHVSPVLLTVSLNTVNMRTEPNMNSAVVSKLAQGSKLIWQHKVSKTTSPVRLRGVRYSDPWLYVKNGQEQDGWVYAATVDVQTTTKEGKNLSLRLMSGRINSFFDEASIQSLITYQNDYIKAQTSEQMIKNSVVGEDLKAKLNKILRKKIHVDPKSKPDVGWLDRVMPGYDAVYDEKKKTYQLVADYAEMLIKAQQTKGDEDDKVFQQAIGK